MAVNVFGFPIQGTAQVAPASITDDTALLPDGANTAWFIALGGADRKIEMPNPALCDGQVRTIITSVSSHKISVLEYDNGDFGGAAIVQAGIDFAGDLQLGTSAPAAVKFVSATFYCDGEDWFVLSATPVAVFT